MANSNLYIKTSKKITLGDDNRVKLSRDSYDNIITIKGLDYKLSNLSKIPGNKGGNSSVFKLTDPTSEDDFEDNDDVLVIKISKFNLLGYKSDFTRNRIRRFQREIIALRKARGANLKNVVTLVHYGIIKIQNSEFSFYTMEKATSDLSDYLSIDLSISQKLLLFKDILDGIEELHRIGIYHRDIKHDNMFVFKTACKVGDLGLVYFRPEDEDHLDNEQRIGAFGWETPEAMNKFFTERAKANIHGFDCLIDQQSDIFQLGKLLWFILQGNLPIGCLELSDFKIDDQQIYAFIVSLLQHSKGPQRRPQNVAVVKQLFLPIAKVYYAG